jgi:hypothetical protein
MDETTDKSVEQTKVPHIMNETADASVEHRMVS